jgi:hypothetical protein
MGDEPHAPHWTAALVIAELRRAMRQPVIRAPPRYSLLPEPKEALPPPNVVVLRDNLDENGSGNRSVKRRPVAKPMFVLVRGLCKVFRRCRSDCRCVVL